MTQKAAPMIHVPDVRATVAWYESIGFARVRENLEDGEMNWALMTFGANEVMFDSGGKPSDAFRREMDLYVTVENVKELYAKLEDRVEMREFIIRDLNRFWITFGQPIEG